MRTLLVAAAAVLAAAGLARAAETYVAQLNGANAGTPSTATGIAIFELSDDLTGIDYNVSYSGLLGIQTGAHVHRTGGAIAFDLGTDINPMIGTWQFVLPQDVDRLRNGQLYVNIHSTLYPMGEIRGTLFSELTPVANTTWGRIKALYTR
jgi:hypothetical protein